MTRNNVLDNLINPNINDSYEAISDGLKRRRLVLFLGDCQVDYNGRASSFLDWGQRLVVAKEDGSILIHKPTGYDAVNWQPPGGIIRSKLKENIVVIETSRTHPNEILMIYVRKFFSITSMKLLDESPLDMHLSEAQLYEAINLQPDLIEDGLKILSNQRHMSHGFADFTGTDKSGKYVIVDVKRKKATLDSVKELDKYVSELRSNTANIRGILAAPEITLEAANLAKSLSLDFRQIDLKESSKLIRKTSNSGQTRLDSNL